MIIRSLKLSAKLCKSWSHNCQPLKIF